MTPEERLASSLMKINRARKHIQDLRSEIDAFFTTKPYAIATRREAETRRLIYYLANVAETPVTISAVAGDVFQNLRSALDHLAFQLYVVGTGSSAGARHVYFPIADDASRYKQESRRKTEGMRKEAVDALAALESYKDGNGHGLWRLHRLNNVDKHRFLIAVGSAFRSVGIDFPSFENFPEIKFPRLYLKPADRLFPLKAGSDLFVDTPDADPKEMPFVFEIALGEPGIAEGEPLVDLLEETAIRVEKTVLSFAPHLH
jgi:hypothetical protein